MKYRYAALAISLVYFSAPFYGADSKPWTHLNFQNDPDDFQFAIVPDRTGGNKSNPIPMAGCMLPPVCRRHSRLYTILSAKKPLNFLENIVKD